MNIFDLSKLGLNSVLNENSTLQEIFSTIRERSDFAYNSLLTCINLMDTKDLSADMHNVEETFPLNSDVEFVVSAGRGVAYLSLQYDTNNAKYSPLRKSYGDRSTMYCLNFGAFENDLVIYRVPGYKTSFEVLTENLKRDPQIQYCSIDISDFSMNTAPSETLKYMHIDDGHSWDSLARVRILKNNEEIITSADHEFNARMEHSLITLQMNAAFHAMGVYGKHTSLFSLLLLDDEFYELFQLGVKK